MGGGGSKRGVKDCSKVKGCAGTTWVGLGYQRITEISHLHVHSEAS